MTRSAPPTETPGRPAFARWLERTNDVTGGFLAAGGVPGLINLAGGLPPPEAFAAEELAELAREAVAGDPGAALGYTPVEGLPDLRDAIARRFSVGGLRLGRGNVLVTSGGMQGLDLIGKVLVEPGDAVAVQAPTYLGALDAWRPREPRYRPMRPEAAGFDPAAAMAGAKFGYAVPNFSNPTGRLVDLEGRRGLVAAARATGCWLVEDDPYALLHYDAPALPRLIELDASDRAGDYDGPVVHLGTLSKELAPGLRVGWVLAAPAMIRALAAAKQGSDMFTGGLAQRVALLALGRGLIEARAPALLALYRERRDALATALDRHLRPWFDWQVPVGGMFVWAVARDPGLDTDALVRVARDEGVAVSPGSVFDPFGANRSAIRLNFTLNPPERLAEGVRRLARAAALLAGGG